MIKLHREQDCCGCSACEQVCARHAISLQNDKKGFLYPVIDVTACNQCGLCNAVCPIRNEGEQRIPSYTYAVKNKDEKVRLDSSSGGLFSILAEQTINKGGKVYGALFDENWNVVHSSVAKAEDIFKMRGSKYVQSILNNTFKYVKADLKTGMPVLFSGTPCQVAGLLRFLKKDYENLTTVDFVCHGVPSPQIWKDYLKETTAAWKSTAGKSTVSMPLNLMSTIKDIRFRDKSNGWEKFRFVLKLAEASAEGKKSSVSTIIDDYIWENDYMRLFLDNYILRPSCHECHFRNGKSGSDYTIADYWQVGRFYPDFDDDKGVSIFLCYKNDMPTYVEQKIEYIETPFEDACYGNRSLRYDYPYNGASPFFYFFHNNLKMRLRRSMVASKFCSDKLCKIKSLVHRLKNKIRKICRR